MPLSKAILRLLGLSQVLHNWRAALASLEAAHREQIAQYADAVAATLARAAAALARRELAPDDAVARHTLLREFGRIAGYVEDIVAALDDHLDGRKIAGVERRLLPLADLRDQTFDATRKPGIDLAHLLEAEGYFRALADGLRVSHRAGGGRRSARAHADQAPAASSVGHASPLHGQVGRASAAGRAKAGLPRT